MSLSFEVKGWHVLAALVAFFLVVFAVNAVFVTAALDTFPGEEVHKPYFQGLHYNDELKARAAQAKLGWSASIVRADLKAEGGAEVGIVEITFADRNGAPIDGLDITGRIFRPADDDADQDLSYSLVGAGRYRTEIAAAAPGVWILQGLAKDSEIHAFEFQTRLTFK